MNTWNSVTSPVINPVWKKQSIPPADYDRESNDGDDRDYEL